MADTEGAGPEQAPEQLLTQALRAQAARAPAPTSPPVSTPPPASASPSASASASAEDNAAERTAVIRRVDKPVAAPASGYGLISGTGADSLERERAALDAAATEATDQPETSVTEPLPVRWIVLLAVLLGLAAGSVVGLLTLV